MIVTLTPNPSVDRTIEVDRLARGEVLRATGGRVDAGGKGVNVARALAAHDRRAVAVLPSGGAEGVQLAGLLSAEGIDVRQVAIAGSVRANVAVVEPDGTVTKLNEPGPTLHPHEIDHLVATMVEASRGAEWAVLSGSLPLGVDDRFYARLVGALHGIGVRVAVDTSGAALVEAVAAGPDLVKPNREELAEAAGTEVRSLADAVAAAGVLRRLGARSVLASLGADGAVLVDAEGAIHGDAPVSERRSTVGAGDAMLAGFLAAGGHGPGSLAEGLAWGAAATSLPGSRMPGPADIDRHAVRLHDDLDTTLELEGEPHGIAHH